MTGSVATRSETALEETNRSHGAERLFRGTEYRERRGLRSGQAPTHSRFIAAMKFFLPLIAIFLIFLVVVWPSIKPGDDTFRIGFADIDAGRDERPSLQNARFFGADEKQRPYSISSDLVTQVSPDGAVIDLEKPKADIALEDDTWLVLTAKTGRFYKRDSVLSLKGDVNLFHDTGYEFHTETATIDMNNGIAKGSDPVAGQGPFGELAAEGFQLLKHGRRIVFTGRATLALYNLGDAK